MANINGIMILIGIILIPVLLILTVMGYLFGWSYFVLIPPLLVVILVKLAFGGAFR